MPLEPGTTLGPYSVTAKIGEGGMGEVYQARDTKLDRDVALKVLPETFTADPDRPSQSQSRRCRECQMPDKSDWEESPMARLLEYDAIGHCLNNWNGRRGLVSLTSSAVSQVSNGMNHGVILC